MEAFNALIGKLTATPTLDKLSAWVEDWKRIEAEERAEEEARHERRMQERQDEMLAAMRADRDDGEEVAA
jgi:hypothetical protein